MDARSFTVKHKGIVNVLKTECFISSSDSISNGSKPPIKVIALWDTGATNSCVSPNLAAVCGLQAVSYIQMQTGNGTAENVGVSLANVHLPQGVTFQNVKVSILPHPTVGFDILIGMDIIAAGDFTITNKDGDAWFTFRVPSQERTDYVVSDNVRNFRDSKIRVPFKHKKKPKR